MGKVRESINIAISFGGTKFAIATIRSGYPPILRRTDRIEWQEHPLWDEKAPLVSLLNLVTNYSKKLLQQSSYSIQDVRLIGIAWPGPGRYEKGLLSATFIPGCKTYQPIHEQLRNEFQAQFKVSLEHIPIVSRLDVNARAFGELRVPQGAFFSTEKSGIVLNIATGIAAAIIKDGKVFSNLPKLGETYGQWGRYLFKNLKTNSWTWRPTQDGSIPEHSLQETRFTSLCGGPALAKRFAQFVQRHKEKELPQELNLAVADYLDDEQRNITAEKTLLSKITQFAYKEVDITVDFIKEVGSEIGGALKCVSEAHAKSYPKQKIVLTGGIGEFFGKPPSGSIENDIFLKAIQTSFEHSDTEILRSTLGLDAEFLGFAP